MQPFILDASMLTAAPNMSAVKPHWLALEVFIEQKTDRVQPAGVLTPSPPPPPPAVRGIYQFDSSGSVMQWSVLSRSANIHQTLQIVPVLSWRGSRCAQITSLTAPMRGAGGGGRVRHGRLALPARGNFYRPLENLPSYLIFDSVFHLPALLAGVFSLSFSFLFCHLSFCLFSPIAFAVFLPCVMRDRDFLSGSLVYQCVGSFPTFRLLQAWLAFTAAKNMSMWKQNPH